MNGSGLTEPPCGQKCFIMIVHVYMYIEKILYMNIKYMYVEVINKN